jgi:hypothetical protein
MLILHERNIERNFKADQHGAATLCGLSEEPIRQGFELTANQERTHPRTSTGGAAQCAGVPGEEHASQRAYCDTRLVPTAAQQSPARRGQRDDKEHASLPGGSKQQHMPGSRPVPRTRTERGKFQRGAADHGRLGRTGSTSEPELGNGSLVHGHAPAGSTGNAPNSERTARDRSPDAKAATWGARGRARPAIYLGVNSQ